MSASRSASNSARNKSEESNEDLRHLEKVNSRAALRLQKKSTEGQPNNKPLIADWNESNDGNCNENIELSASKAKHNLPSDQETRLINSSV